MLSRRNGPKESTKESGGIHFGDHASVGGDVFTGDKTVTTYNTGVDAEALLKLLEQLQSAIEDAPLADSEKELAGGNVAAAIHEMKGTSGETSPTKLQQVGGYLQDTKTLLDRVTDIGEIGKKAMPIILKAAAMIGLHLL
jgi:hypothetical protein